MKVYHLLSVILVLQITEVHWSLRMVIMKNSNVWSRYIYIYVLVHVIMFEFEISLETSDPSSLNIETTFVPTLRNFYSYGDYNCINTICTQKPLYSRHQKQLFFQDIHNHIATIPSLLTLMKKNPLHLHLHIHFSLNHAYEIWGNKGFSLWSNFTTSLLI